MGEVTGIEWTDHTRNFWVGCEKVSPACVNCYAERDAQRFHPNTWGKGSRRVIMRLERARADLLKWNAAAEAAGKRARVFPNSMSDIFEDRPELVEPREFYWGVVRETPWLEHLLLTKRPENGPRMVPKDFLMGGTQAGGPHHNLRIGVTVEDQARLRRFWELVEWWKWKNFISMEPLLERVDLRPLLYVGREGGWEYEGAKRNMLHWVIPGGESGAGARPTGAGWVRSVVEQCVEAGVPVFFKQWGDLLPMSQLASWNGRVFGKADAKPTYLIFEGETFARVGKADAGALLDGVAWKQFPEAGRPAGNGELRMTNAEMF